MSSSVDFRPRPLKHDVGGKVPRLRFSIGRKGESPIQKRRTAQNVKERPAKTHPSRKGSRELNSRVLQWLVLCGIPYRGSGVRLGAPHPAQRTSFPLPSSGRPNGHREAPLLICNSQRLAHPRPYCKSSVKEAAEKRVVSGEMGAGLASGAKARVDSLALCGV